MESQDNHSERIRKSNEDGFPSEVRHHLADWLQLKCLNAQHCSRDHPEFMLNAKVFLTDLILELNRKINSLNEFSDSSMKLKLTEAAENIKFLYSDNPEILYNLIVNGTIFEGQNEKSEIAAAAIKIDVVIFNQHFEFLHSLLGGTQFELQNFIQLYEKSCLDVNEYAMIFDNFMTPYDQQLMDIQLRIDGAKIKMTQTIVQTQVTFLKILDQIEKGLCQIQKFLSEWKKNQLIIDIKQSGEVLNSETPTLDQVQNWCEALAMMLWKLKEQVNLVLRYKIDVMNTEINYNNISALLPQITRILERLIISSFIVEKQPRQVVKTNTRFTATLRLLVGNTLHLTINKPKVKVFIISESEAGDLKNGLRQSFDDYILNNTGTMEYNEETRHLSISLQNMQLKKIKRADKKATETVTDEKFALLFKSDFDVGQSDFISTVCVLSVPMVVIVHGNQEPPSWATITWDNANELLNPERESFLVSTSLSWNQLSHAINMKYIQYTDRQLTAENLHYLCEKILKKKLTYPTTGDELFVSWAQFAKDPLPERTFTFWEWFYSTMKVTQEHFKKLWSDGKIMGFIDKTDSEKLLERSEIGTFILRFSDSELGGISIAYVDKNSQIVHITPLTSKNLSQLSLYERIFDSPEFIQFYPNLPKELFVGQYLPPKEQKLKLNYRSMLIKPYIPDIRQSNEEETVSPPGCSTSSTQMFPDANTTEKYDQEWASGELDKFTVLPDIGPMDI